MTKDAIKKIGLILSHPLTIIAIFLLLVNDHILKKEFPGALTGKLSDVAGLFFFPYLVLLLLIFINHLFKRPLAVLIWSSYIIIGLLFGFIKSITSVNMAAKQIIHFIFGYHAQIVVDSTDLLALIVLLPSFLLLKSVCQKPVPEFKNAKLFVQGLVLCVALTAVAATSPPQYYAHKGRAVKKNAALLVSGIPGLKVYTYNGICYDATLTNNQGYFYFTNTYGYHNQSSHVWIEDTDGSANFGEFRTTYVNLVSYSEPFPDNTAIAIMQQGLSTPPTLYCQTTTQTNTTTTFYPNIYGDSMTDLWDTAIAPQGTILVDAQATSNDAFGGEDHGSDGQSIEIAWNDAASGWNSYSIFFLYGVDTDWTGKTLSFWGKASLDTGAATLGYYSVIVLVDDAAPWEAGGDCVDGNPSPSGCNVAVNQYTNGGLFFRVTPTWQKFTIDLAAAGNTYNSYNLISLNSVRNIQFMTAQGGVAPFNTDSNNKIYIDDIYVD